MSTGLIGNAGPSLTGCQNSRGGPKSRMGWLRNPGDWLKCVKVDAMGFRSIRYRTGPRNVRRTDISWLSRRAVCAALRVCDSRRGRVCGGDIQDIGISTFTSCWRNRRHQGSRLRAMTKSRKKKQIRNHAKKTDSDLSKPGQEAIQCRAEPGACQCSGQ
jgi:hypothetical protein